MWWVRLATMTRRTERLSRLLRLWLTTMPSDFATIPRLSRLSLERLCDFPARVCDFGRAADLPTGSAAFSFPADWRRVPPGRRGRCRGFRPDLKVETFFSPLYCIAAVFAKNLDYFLHLRLTSKCKYAILYLPKGSKRKLNFERGLHYENL